MKKLWCFLLALCVLAALSSCTKAPDDPKLPDSSSGSLDVDLPVTGTDDAQSDALLYKKYADVAALPGLEVDLDAVCVFDDRTLTLEDRVENEPELLTYNVYYHIASARFDDLMELVGEAEAIQIAMRNEGVNFEEGRYCTQVTIHSLETLTAEDLSHIWEPDRADVLEKIDTFGIQEYVIVKLEESWTYNEAALEAGPQLGDGERYTRYYLFAKTEKVPEFKLYGVYWEDFFTE